MSDVDDDKKIIPEEGGGLHRFADQGMKADEDARRNR